MLFSSPTITEILTIKPKRRILYAPSLHRFKNETNNDQFTWLESDADFIPRSA